MTFDKQMLSVQEGLADPMYNQMRSPLMPTTTLSLDERLAQYHEAYGIAVGGDTGPSVSPQEAPQDAFLPQQSTSPDDHKDAMNDWLAPLASDVHTDGVADIPQQDHYNHFVENTLKDPAISELIDKMHGEDGKPGLLDALGNAVATGQMTYQEAVKHGLSVMDEHFAPVVEKHHGGKDKDTKERTLIKRGNVNPMITKAKINGGKA